jgi:hypothetical protein
MQEKEVCLVTRAGTAHVASTNLVQPNRHECKCLSQLQGRLGAVTKRLHSKETELSAVEEVNRELAAVCTLGSTRLGFWQSAHCPVDTAWLQRPKPVAASPEKPRPRASKKEHAARRVHDEESEDEQSDVCEMQPSDAV